MAQRFGGERPELLGNDYLVFGTLDRKDWLEGQKGEPPHEMINRVYTFKDVWDFEIIPGGWYPPQ